MTATDAYFKVIRENPKCNIVACYEYESRFTFIKIPPDATYDKEKPYCNAIIAVMKDTGKITTFRPFDISVEEYHNGKEVKDFKKKRGGLRV